MSIFGWGEKEERGPSLTLMQQPEKPTAAAAEDTAAQDELAARKRRKGRRATILTSPQGLLGEAPTEKKVLLGQ